MEGPAALRSRLVGGVAALATTRREGDLRPSSGGPDRRDLVDRRWTFVRQVHGSRVLVVTREHPAERLEADALVTADPSACLAVLGADCALLGLASREGLFGVAHAGWRGLLGGVVAETVRALRRLGASHLEGVLGPCIHAECYAFGPGPLEEAVAAFGPSVAATTATGEPALDLPAGVDAALAREGVAAPARLGGCTACGGDYFSYRARREAGRQALALWRTRPGEEPSGSGPGGRPLGEGL